MGLAGLHALIEFMNYSRHIHARFMIRRYSVIFVDGCRPSVVRGQCKREILVIPGEKRIEIR